MMVEGLQTSAKCEFSAISDHLAPSTVYNVSYDMVISLSTASEGALECAGFNRRLVFTWSEAGAGRLQTGYDWQKPPWRQ